MTRQIKFHKGEMYEFEMYKLVDEYDPVLKTKPTPFDFNHVDARKVATFHAISLLETMSKNHGIGLAANQVGLDVRLFVMGSEGVGYAFFNPTIVDVFGETSFEEGCLSYPGLFLPIKRPEAVKIKYFDMYGEEKTQEFSGLSARVILHEYDHMEGITMVTKVSPLILDRCKRKVKKNLKLLKAQYEKVEKQRIIAQAAERVILEQRKKYSQEEIEFMAANPGVDEANVAAILKARADANLALEKEESPKRVSPVVPPVKYVAEPLAPQENNQQNQVVVIETGPSF